MLYGALEAGGTKMVCALGDENGTILEQTSIPTTTPEETLSAIIAWFRDKEIASLGVACFGPVDLRRNSPTYGYITTTPKKGWANFDIVGTLKRALGVLVGKDQSVTAAGGYIIQLLPGAPDDIIDKIEAGIQNAGAVSRLLAAGMDGQVVLETVLHGFELEILETQPVEYRCYCSRDRVTRTLISLGRKELQSIVDDGKDIHIDCQFCDKIYDYTPQQVQNILNELDAE